MARIQLVGNILKVATLTEQEFLADYEDVYQQALEVEDDVIVLDLSDARGLGDDAFRLIALTHISTDRRGKQFRARVPEELAKAFKHGGLAKQIDVVVMSERPLLELVPDHERTPLPAPAPNPEQPTREIEKPPPLPAQEPPSTPAPPSAPPTPAGPPDVPKVVEQDDTRRIAAVPGQATASAADADGDTLPPDIADEIRRELLDEDSGDTAYFDGGEFVPGAVPVEQEKTVLGTSPAEDSGTPVGNIVLSTPVAGETDQGFGAPDSAQPPSGVWRLVEKNSGEEVPIDRPEIVIGRKAFCDVVIDVPYVSKRHARIFAEGGQFFIEDLGSSNGTYVNRLRITERMPLRQGLHIQIARTSEFPEGVREYIVHG